LIDLIQKKNKLGLSCAKLRLNLASQLNKLGETRYKQVVVFPMSLTLKLDYNWVHKGCKINFHGWVGWVGGWGGVLDQMKIRLTQPQVELELGLSLAKKYCSNQGAKRGWTCRSC
jgi:hypothetical protein